VGKEIDRVKRERAQKSSRTTPQELQAQLETKRQDAINSIKEASPEELEGGNVSPFSTNYGNKYISGISREDVELKVNSAHALELEELGFGPPPTTGMTIVEEVPLFGDALKENIKPGVPELFESNPELANSIYETLGFKSKPDVILPIGTSGSGKSTFVKSLPQENLVVIEPDAMRVEFTGNMNDKSKDKEIYEEAAKRAIAAIKQGKQVVFDTTNLTKDKRLPFIEAIKKAIPTANIQYKLMELNPELAKQRIKAQLVRGENRAAVSDETIDRHTASYKQMLDDIKNEPISNFEITPQQKQEAQQLYSEYLESLNKPNTNPILQDNQQEQVKKFKELQERLNNKEFIEGAKNSYESSKELQQFGTQEQYNDYIARVSLGIIKNPSSGEYNYTSKVKEIVHHGSSVKIEEFEVQREPLFHFGTVGAALQRGGVIHNILLNIEELQHINDGMWFLGTEKGGLLKLLLDRGILTKDQAQRILDIKNEAISNSYHDYPGARTQEGEQAGAKELQKILHNRNIGFSYVNLSEDAGSFSYAVPKPEQIHILGSKKDIEGFKKFIGNENNVQETQGPPVRRIPKSKKTKTVLDIGIANVTKSEIESKIQENKDHHKDNCNGIIPF
jgi:predicted kinase